MTRLDSKQTQRVIFQCSFLHPNLLCLSLLSIIRDLFSTPNVCAWHGTICAGNTPPVSSVNINLVNSANVVVAVLLSQIPATGNPSAQFFRSLSFPNTVPAGSGYMVQVM